MPRVAVGPLPECADRPNRVVLSTSGDRCTVRSAYPGGMRIAVWGVLCTVCLACGHALLGMLGLLLLAAVHDGTTRTERPHPRTGGVPAPLPQDQPRPRTPSARG